MTRFFGLKSKPRICPQATVYSRNLLCRQNYRFFVFTQILPKAPIFYINFYNRFFLDAIFSANGEKLSRSKISSTATARIRGSRDITGLEILEQELYEKILKDFEYSMDFTLTKTKFEKSFETLRKDDKTDDNFSKLWTPLCVILINLRINYIWLI